MYTHQAGTIPLHLGVFIYLWFINDAATSSDYTV
jgi:hypothetical protein